LSVSCLDSFSGYGGSWPFPLNVGGIVACGLRLVSAKMRALATLSAYVLNSAPGVIWFKVSILRVKMLREGFVQRLRVHDAHGQHSRYQVHR
jgi:hypothetical protein